MTNPVKRPLMAAALALLAAPADAADLCQGFGPQAPRDIASVEGANPITFEIAPPAAEMVLCDIHTHTNAEHKGPGFSKSAGNGLHGGFECSDQPKLLLHERFVPLVQRDAFHNAGPGDTLEVHWVYTTCDTATAGPGLGSCVPEGCENPQLRVESQVFLLANDPRALDFMEFAFQGNTVDGRNQPKALPEGTGAPVVFLGSTTGPSYTSQECSPYQVTWSVRPECARLDINSLYEWGRSHNVFNEHHSHGVRRLVTAPELLSSID